MPQGSRLPPQSWLICPNGHKIAYAVSGARFRAGWEDEFSSIRQSLGAPRDCHECGASWRKTIGGNALVNWIRSYAASEWTQDGDQWSAVVQMRSDTAPQVGEFVLIDDQRYKLAGVEPARLLIEGAKVEAA